MKRNLILISLVFFFLSGLVSFAETQIASGFFRYGGNYPLDPTSVYTNYDDAVSYAEGGRNGTSSAYKGQVISVPTVGTFYIDDDWELKGMGGDFIVHAGDNVDVYDFETQQTKELYIKMDYDTSHDYTSFTNISYYGTNYLTLLIPQKGQRGSDGSNLKFGGYWDQSAVYEKDTLVSYEGSVYVSRLYVPSQTSITNTTFWRAVVEKGDKGEQGNSGEMYIGDVITVPPEEGASVTNVGTATNAILNFAIPRGYKGDPGVGLVYAGYWTNTYLPYNSNTLVRYGTNLWYTEITNSSIPSQSDTWSVFLQDGPQGKAGTISIGQVSSGSSAVVTNVGTPQNATLNFVIPKGDKGDPGNNFAIYAGAWTDTPSTSYVSNSWLTWRGGTYGVLESFMPTHPSTPQTYVDAGKMVVLALSGTNGVNGLNGSGMIPYGDWKSGQEYPQYAMVRYDDSQYYCKISKAEPGQTPSVYTNVWELFVKDGLNISDAYVTTNAFWAGKFELVNYVSNSIVYWDAYPYGTYYVLRDCTPEEYGVGYNPIVPNALNNTNYFTKIANFGKDGSNGARGPAGKDGKDGLNGLDGIGNILYDGSWYSQREYPTNVIVSTTNSEYGYALFISTYASSNICPGVSSGWQNYWELLIESGKDGENGMNGGDYRFMLGWDSEFDYKRYDICVISNNFYLCNQDSTGEPPWQWEGSIWTKLISPDYRFYGLSPSRYYSQTETYVSNELVRYNGSTYVVISENVSNITPGTDTNKWAIFAAKGDKGDIGATGPQGATGPKGEQGLPGLNLVYYSYWLDNTNYPLASLVRYGTNLWYAPNGSLAGDIPGQSDNWEVYLRDGKPAIVTVSTNTITTNENAKAEVIVTPTPGGNEINLQFVIPQGKTGETGPQGQQGIPGVDVVYYGQWIQGFPYSSNSLVRYETNLWYCLNDDTIGTPGIDTEDWKLFLSDGSPALITVSTNTITTNETGKADVIVTHNPPDSNNINLQFVIPQGKTGATGQRGPQGERGLPGMNLVYYGNWESGKEYQEESLVRYATNLWYSTNVTTGTPGTDNAWIPFLNDGRDGINGQNGTNATIFVSGTETLNPGESATVIPTYSTNNTHVDLLFKIPRGETGYAIIPVVSNTVTLDTGINAYVSNTISGTTNYLTFGIPRGLTGEKGDIGIEYKGDWEATTYSSNSVVRYTTNLWYTGEATTSEDIPGTSQKWELFLKDGEKGEQGIQGETGPAIIPVVSNTVTLDTGINAYVSNLVVGTTNYLEFGIPRGLAGEKGEIGIDYKGSWSAISFLSNSLVRYTTNLWYAGQTTESTDIPGESQKWELFLKDGDKGDVGETIYPIALETNTTTLSPGTQAWVTNEIIGTNSYFYFGIPQGIQGEKGENGGALIPKGTYSETNSYGQYDLVRYDTAQYYVHVSETISGIVPTNTDYWTLFVQDGQGIAANATLIVDSGIEYSGILNLDTNTLVVTNIDNSSFLTVVGGGGGGASQWEIDLWGGVMPSLDIASGIWDYDNDGDLMPPQ